MTAPSARAASRALLVVSAAVLLAGSTWFSGTAAVPALRASWGLGDAQAAWLTVAVQLGFITGTFVYAVFNVADVWSARRVFAASALAAAACNAGFAWASDGLASALAFRYLTGVTLAGVYPVGMKIVASWFRDGLGWRLGVLVGALGIGTASPYLVRALGAGGDWRALAGSASVAAVAAAVLVTVALADGPFLRTRARFDIRAAGRVFRDPSFRLVALGYFGHMWELYALWSLVLFFVAGRGWSPADSALVAFATVGAGAIGCVGGGLLSRRIGERRVALGALVASAACCALSGFAYALPAAGLVAFLVLWGTVAVADSPQFSALAAQCCPPEYTATALTVQNGVGFAVTVASLQLLPLLAGHLGWRWAFTVLAIGPALGAVAMARLGRFRPD
ncbi:MAG: MFS transporter [Vicinamibacteria bacterium]